jgi:hypothetical protein
MVRRRWRLLLALIVLMSGHRDGADRGRRGAAQGLRHRPLSDVTLSATTAVLPAGHAFVQDLRCGCYELRRATACSGEPRGRTAGGMAGRRVVHRVGYFRCDTCCNIPVWWEGAVAEPNDQLRGARERTESPYATGESLSRQELAELVNAWVFEHTDPPRVIALDANYIGKLEQGIIRWPQDPVRRAAFRAVLNVRTDTELGFRRPRRSTVVDVDRQQFLRAALGTGVSAAAAVSPSALVDLLVPTQAIRIPSVVGRDEIEDIRSVTQMFDLRLVNYGSGLVREAAVAQLRYCAELLNAHCPERLRNELYVAVGDLANTTAIMAHDAYVHDDASRMHRFALACAEAAENWQLRARVLADMASMEIRCGDPDTALTLVETAMVRAERLTASQRANLMSRRGHALAKLHRVQDAATAVGRADEEFSQAVPAEDPPWLAFYDGSMHNASTGHALWPVAMDGQFVSEAAGRISVAISGCSGQFSRVYMQAKLASLTMATGDPVEATAIGNQALDTAAQLRSGRVAEEFRTLRRSAARHSTMPAVAELRHRIGVSR